MKKILKLLVLVLVLAFLYFGFTTYPKLDLIATAVIISNLRTLENAEPDIRDMVFDLIENPVQIKKESGPRGDIEVMYDLKIT